MFPRCSRGNSRLRASWLLPEEPVLGEKLHLGVSSPDLLLCRDAVARQGGFIGTSKQGWSSPRGSSTVLSSSRDIPPHTSCVLTHPCTHICPLLPLLLLLHHAQAAQCPAPARSGASPLLGQHPASCRGTHWCVLAGGAHLGWFQVALPPPRTAPWLSPRLGPVSQSGGAQLISSAAKAGN